MMPRKLPPDDLPPPQAGATDGRLQRQLEDSISKQFYETCDGAIQTLLTECEWYFTSRTSTLTLVIACPDLNTNWHVLNHVVAIAAHLANLSPTAKIRVCPPVFTGTPVEIRVDEISVYRD